MIDVNKYYNADKAFEDSKKAADYAADRAFNSAVNRNQALFNDIISLISKHVNDGEISFTYLPHNPDDYQKIIDSHHIIPSDMRVFSDEQQAVFTILRMLGYFAYVVTDDIYFDGMTPTVDEPIHINLCRISWNGGITKQKLNVKVV